MHALTRPCLPPAWAAPCALRVRCNRPRLARARRSAHLTPLALDPASLAAALTAALGGVSDVADSVTPDTVAASVAGAVSVTAAAMSARDAMADGDGGGDGAGSNGNGGGGGGGDGRARENGDFCHRNALPSFVCALVTVALLRAHEDAAAAAFGWASFALLLLPLPFTLEVLLCAGVFVHLVRRRALKAAAEDK
jgi:hypothetical protein